MPRSSAPSQPDATGVAPPSAPVREAPHAGAVEQLAGTFPEGLHHAVFGAPGSGKTTLAVELVADRIGRLGYGVDDVLVLCASRSTATALRDRIAVRLGVTTRGPLARTANSMAFQLVRAYTGRPVTLLTGGEHDRIVADLVDGGIRDGFGPEWPDPLSPEVRVLRGFRTELRDLLMRAVELGVDELELARLGEAAGRPEWIAASEFMAEYADVKDQVRPDQFDSAELGAFAASIVRRSRVDPEASAVLGPLAGLRLLVVDDAQETTEASASLIAAFAACGVQIIAVGDPDVASNGFRGGRPELLGSLGQMLDGAPVRRIDLPTVHRGRAEILEVISGVRAHVGTALGGSHRSAALAETRSQPAGIADGADGAGTAAAAAVAAARGGASHVTGGHPLAPVLGIEAASSAAEHLAIASLLRERHLLDGVPWSQMTVVLRSGGDVPSVERALALADVPTAGAAAGLALRDAPAAAALLTACSFVLGREPLTADLAVALLTGPIGRLDGIGLRRLRLALRHEELASGGTRTGDELLVDALAAPGGFVTIDAAPGRRAARLAAVLDAATEVARGGGTIEEVLWSLWEGGGLGTEWGRQAAGSGVLADEADRSLDAAVALFSAATRFVEREPGAPAVRFVDEVLASELPEDSLAPRRTAETVLVTTPQGVVGREFDVVVVAGLQDAVWPNLRPRGTLLHAGLLPRVVAAARAGAPLPGVETPVEARASVRDDELRMFVLAVSRARSQVVLACTANDDEQPSVLMGYARERVRPRRRPLQLRSLVGALRREAVTGDPESAAALALLAEEGVPGANPGEWYGLAGLSNEAPLVDLDGDPEASVQVSPSQIDRVEESPLGWFVDHVASPPSGVAASIGTIVHAVVEEVGGRDDGATDVEQIWAAVEERLKGVRFEAGWVAERERRGARRMAEGAAEYLSGFDDDAKVLLGAEGRFTITIDRVRITGTIDRIEASPDGTTVIVDIKTGRTAPTFAQTAAHPQLAAYQLAARRQAVPSAGVLGGAKLVYVATPSRGLAYTERAQQPFDDEAEAAFRERLGEVGRIMAGSSFEGTTEPGHRSRFGSWQYRVHLVPAVSA
ncbi:Superfamily I DNA or RNA helicase [Agromyces sp. CF514]|uniref:UrvD/REP family ATP-dependent DNA helicase n=1 Tax=Agromyces sp. CF514 TaxID=1881031 RepID=UPI0008DF8F7A|nr:UrvD/REP family ATP-dependent DNA helicase [Agromyces sp. CF514]SFR74511.1 Superfamily I DNA or RNA helicase [Agromyces sp. CF514]